MLYRPYLRGLYASIGIPVHRYALRFDHSPATATDTAAHAALGPETSSNADSAQGHMELIESYEPRGFSAALKDRANRMAQEIKLNIGDHLYLRSNTDIAATVLPDRTLVLLGPLHAPKEPQKATTPKQPKAAKTATRAKQHQGATSPRTDSQDKQSAMTNSAVHATTANAVTVNAATANAAAAHAEATVAPVVVVDHTVTAATTAQPTTATNKSATAVEAAEAADSSQSRAESTQDKLSHDSVWSLKIRVVNLWLDMIGQIVLHDVIPAENENQLYADVDSFIPANLKPLAQEIKLKAPHNQYRYELAILDAVAEGNVDKVVRAFTIPLQGKLGVLGPTPLRSAQNHVHNLTAIVSRVAINVGILPEKAFALADKFFMASESCTTVEQCNKMQVISARAFAAMVKEYRDQHRTALPKLVQNTMLLVSRSLYEKCTVADIAARLSVSADHLERVFYKSMHLRLAGYINAEKIKEAQELLRSTTESIADIGAMLGYSSNSYFTRCFKQYTGLTPLEYRQNAHDLTQG